jgi:hypothetical protein
MLSWGWYWPSNHLSSQPDVVSTMRTWGSDQRHKPGGVRISPRQIQMNGLHFLRVGCGDEPAELRVPHATATIHLGKHAWRLYPSSQMVFFAWEINWLFGWMRCGWCNPNLNMWSSGCQLVSRAGWVCSVYAKVCPTKSKKWRVGIFRWGFACE